MMKRYLPLVLACAICFVLGIFVGVKFRNPCTTKSNSTQIRLGGYRFTNPLLECDAGNSDLNINPELQPFKYKVQDYVDRAVSNRDATMVAVYFRDLNNGPWFGINEREKFSPSSMLKVPLMMAYLKASEKDPSVLQKKLIYKGNVDYNPVQTIDPSKTLKPGNSYTVAELIRAMIAHSDNNAWTMLFDNIDKKFLDNILKHLQVDYDPGKDEDFMSIRAYSSFYRVLYNASYLGREKSEAALELLSYVDFVNGIIAGVPSNVPVASKFGERVLGANGEIKQLHEFGIIYFPHRPYLLGIMTRGTDFARLEKILREISRLVYSEVEKQRP